MQKFLNRIDKNDMLTFYYERAVRKARSSFICIITVISKCKPLHYIPFFQKLITKYLTHLFVAEYSELSTWIKATTHGSDNVDKLLATYKENAKFRNVLADTAKLQNSKWGIKTKKQAMETLMQWQLFCWNKLGRRDIVLEGQIEWLKKSIDRSTQEYNNA